MPAVEDGVPAASARILLISDGNPGHYNQAVAVAELLEPVLNARTEWLEVRQRIPGVLRPLIAALLDRLPRLDLATALKGLFGVGRLPQTRPLLVVSSGGKTAFFNVLAARHFGCANLFLGDGPPLAARNFSLVVTTEAGTGCPNCLQWDYLATRITPAKAAAEGAAYRAAHALAESPLWAMLIGGDSRSHRYTDADWQTLAAAMNRLAEHHGIRWLIASSRRTGAPAERTLRQALAPQAVADAAWWGEAQRSVIPAFLGASSLVVCTQDSLSMITEAVASGRPAYVVSPASVRLDPVVNRVYHDYLTRNSGLGRIRRLAIAELAAIDPREDRAHHFRPIGHALGDELLAQLLPRLRARHPELEGAQNG